MTGSATRGVLYGHQQELPVSALVWRACGSPRFATSLWAFSGAQALAEPPSNWGGFHVLVALLSDAYSSGLPSFLCPGSFVLFPGPYVSSHDIPTFPMGFLSFLKARRASSSVPNTASCNQSPKNHNHVGPALCVKKTQLLLKIVYLYSVYTWT